MATLLSSHSLVLRPDHRILLLRDIDSDAGVGANEAITQTHESIAATSGYGVYVETAQDSLAVRVEVEVWDTEPDHDPRPEYRHGSVLHLDCPTGHLQVGDDMGNAISDILPPQGPGRFNVAFHHQGREKARDLERQLFNLDSDDRETIDETRESWAGTESYLFRVWWQSPLPDDEDDDDDDLT